LSPGSLDARIVQRHLVALDGALAQLRKHVGRPLSLLETDLDELWAVERGLQIASQNALDVATHIAATSGKDVPSYASAIDELASLGVIEAAFARRFRAIAGFRNVLVHGYLELDKSKLHTLLNQHLDDFAQFATAIRTYLPGPGG
jgi:uncharacterized protein YutE (UPF0331/DUF86 family)